MDCSRTDYRPIAALVDRSADLTVVAVALSDAWADDYRQHVDDHALVEVDLDSFTYLFDMSAERLVGVYGISGRASGPRPAERIRGHPLPREAAGSRQLDRGHVVAHSIGGGADINLVPQLHALNISGEWRALERYLQANPGSFFAVQLEYDNDSQSPARFIYSVIRDGQLESRAFVNR